jgi:hypothetical protein
LVTVGLAWSQADPRAWVLWPLLALSAWWAVERFGVLSLVSAYLAFRLLWMGLLTTSPGRLGFGVSSGSLAAVLLLGLGVTVWGWMTSRRRPPVIVV